MTFSYLSAYLAFIMSLPIGYAYLRISRSASDIVRHMSISIFCVVSAFAWRSIFWDAVPVWVDDNWPVLRDSIGGREVNNLWNLVFAYGCYRALRALQLMVPEEDRPKWPFWIAWLYPPRRRRRIVSRD